MNRRGKHVLLMLMFLLVQQPLHTQYINQFLVDISFRLSFFGFLFSVNTEFMHFHFVNSHCIIMHSLNQNNDASRSKTKTYRKTKKKCPRINWNLFCLLSVFFSWLLNYLSSLGTIEDINYKM